MKRIILIGYMGAGKTTVGKALAKDLGLMFYDLDWYIETRMRKTVAQIFEERGEEGFRKIEYNMLHEVAEFEDVVISCGGGTPCFFDNMDYLNQQGETIYLQGSPDVLAQHLRMGKGVRPLLLGKTDEELMAYIRESLEKREPFYKKARHIINIDLMDNLQAVNEMVEKVKGCMQGGESSIHVVKVGGAVVEDEAQLAQLIEDFSRIEGKKVLVHGGGRRATKVAAQLGIESRMVGGRRITDAEMLNVVTMVYGGLVNKHLVAMLQAKGVNAIGLTGADMDVIRSHRRPLKKMVVDGEEQMVDFGYVGDVDRADGKALATLLDQGVVPVIAPLTHDGNGNILNTNADTMASEVAKALAAEGTDPVTLIYSFEKKGVLSNPDDDDSVIPEITHESFEQLQADGTISGGMLPKIENALSAIDAGVNRVIITLATAIDGKHGTVIRSL